MVGDHIHIGLIEIKFQQLQHMLSNIDLMKAQDTKTIGVIGVMVELMHQDHRAITLLLLGKILLVVGKSLCVACKINSITGNT